MLPQVLVSQPAAWAWSLVHGFNSRHPYTGLPYVVWYTWYRMWVFASHSVHESKPFVGVCNW